MTVPWKVFWLPAMAILSVVLALAACGSDEPELPGTTAASVLAYLDEVDYRNSDDWKLWPGTTEKYQGDDPHGAQLTTSLNPAAFGAIGGTMPSGAIIVKENYTPAGELAATTLMYKQSGYNPDHSDWFWITGSGSRNWPMAPWKRRARSWVARTATSTARTTSGGRNSSLRRLRMPGD